MASVYAESGRIFDRATLTYQCRYMQWQIHGGNIGEMPPNLKKKKETNTLLKVIISRCPLPKFHPGSAPVYGEDIMKKFLDGWKGGISIGGRHINRLRYADRLP